VAEPNEHLERFCGVYSMGDALDWPRHELTPPRHTVKEVVADLVEIRRSRRIVYFAQIIDMATLAPIESDEATIARLRQAET
jgi:hypothetical protein